MVRDIDKKGSWFVVALMLIVFCDLVALTLVKDAPTSLWLIIGCIEAVSIVSLFLAGKWYTTAQVEHEQFEVMGFILDQLNHDEVTHVLSELKQKNLNGFQKRIVERLIDEHCHIKVHF